MFMLIYVTSIYWTDKLKNGINNIKTNVFITIKSKYKNIITKNVIKITIINLFKRKNRLNITLKLIIKIK